MVANLLQPLLEQLEPGAIPAELGKRVVENFLRRPTGDGAIHPAQVCTWYGALRVAELLGDSALTEQLVARYAPLLTRGGRDASPAGPERQRELAAVHIQDPILGLVPLEIARQTGQPLFLQAGIAFAEAQRLSTNPGGADTDTSSSPADLFMRAALQVEAYRATGHVVYLESVVSKVSVYLERFQQPSGFFFHARTSPVVWGRGNGWIAAGVTQLLLALPEAHPQRAAILGRLRRLLSAALGYQDFTGGFRQLLNVPDAWLEMSGTSMFTFAMVSGLRRGWLDAEQFTQPARDAWHCVADHLDAEGNLSAICPDTSEAFEHVGSDPGAQERYYLRRPRERGDHHGQAALLWTIAALLTDD